MEQRISIVTLGVANLERSGKFYERLGWRRSVSNAEGIIFYQAGGMALALYPRSHLAKDANVPPEGQGHAACLKENDTLGVRHATPPSQALVKFCAVL